ncbi:MAG TPA: CrcB family protein [Pseudonocardiaceae bacterium]
MSVLLVALGGACGAVLRFVVSRLVPAPFGTGLVNAGGSLLLGLVTGAALARPWTALLAAGLCGALTTYSTFAAETVGLLGGRPWWRGPLNAVANVVLAVGALVLGRYLVSA